jgi:rhamnosyltransferase
MPHTVGEGAYEVKGVGIRTPRQRDFRYETYVRNTVYGFRLPHIPLSWKLRQGGYLAAQVAFIGVKTGFRPSLMRRFARGIADGLRGRLGPPEGARHT